MRVYSYRNEIVSNRLFTFINRNFLSVFFSYLGDYCLLKENRKKKVRAKLINSHLKLEELSRKSIFNFREKICSIELDISHLYRATSKLNVNLPRKKNCFLFESLMPNYAFTHEIFRVVRFMLSINLFYSPCDLVGVVRKVVPCQLSSPLTIRAIVMKIFF